MVVSMFILRQKRCVSNHVMHVGKSNQCLVGDEAVTAKVVEVNVLSDAADDG